MSEQKPSHEVEGIARRALRQDCVKAQIWGRIPKHFYNIQGPQEHNASIILKWKKIGTTKTLPRAAHPAKLSNQWRRALVRETELQSFSVEMGEPSRRTTISAAFH